MGLKLVLSKIDLNIKNVMKNIKVVKKITLAKVYFAQRFIMPYEITF